MGFFAYPPNEPVQYVGGVFNHFVDIETDDMRFSDLDHYAVAFDYNMSNFLVYFQCDGHFFEKNVRVLYVDESIREMVDICLSYGSIHLYINHFDLEDLQTKQAEMAEIVEKQNKDEGFVSEKSRESDLDFENEEEDDESEDLEFNTDMSDEELMENVKNRKIRKAALINKQNTKLRIFL
ncbi:hypothetical protein POM88_021246 [Heracleum sosnowskyi]|uniref:PB1-like domain-containing protein n=1 Tax=Heracleum sosnowskyi TaxID=360622 RepID=A0AAD8IDI6_9APIA|nr:hypothetical protein POM88_021246 [Heracleum sosnowskyi]